MTAARSERLLLGELLAEVGPDAPTLCSGWRTRDLAAHLVLRDRRPDTLPGMFISSLAKYTEKQQLSLAASPWPPLVAKLRSGPPRWFPTGWAPIDALVNTLEFFVHHEDVLRANPEVPIRDLPEDLTKALWSAVSRFSRLTLSRSPVGIVLRSEGWGELQVCSAEPRVILSGSPGELALYLCGRREAAKVSVEGSPEARTAFAGISLKI